MPNDGVTADVRSQIPHNSSPKRDSTLIGRVMARAANGTGDWLVRSIAIGAVAIIIGMVGYTLHTVMTNSNENSKAISAINERLMYIERELGALNGQ